VTRYRTAWDELALRGLWIAFIGTLVALPLAAMSALALREGPAAFGAAVLSARVRDALLLTLWTSALAAGLNALFGTALAWALARYRFPGRRLLSTVIDLPFSIPTLVTGVMIVLLFGPQSPVGGTLERLGLPIAFAWPGILIALLFVTLPIVVRAVEPVLLAMDPAEEEAAIMLGAGPIETFRRVVLPGIRGAVLTGTIQSFARAVAEFGAIVVVSGNIPGRTLTAPVLIYGEVEGGRADVAGAVSFLLLALAVALLLLRRTVEARVAND